MTDIQTAHKKKMERLRELLFAISFGDQPPTRNEDEFMLWWLTREKFFRPAVNIPMNVPGRIRQKAVTRAKKLNKKFTSLLERPDKRHRLPSGGLPEAEQIAARAEILSIQRQLAGKPEPRLSRSKFINENITNSTPLNNKIKIVDVPVLIKLKIDPSKLADGNKVLDEIHHAFEKSEPLHDNIRQSPYINTILKTEDDAITVALPKSMKISDENKRVRQPINLQRVRMAIKLYFKRSHYSVRWINGQWHVSIPNFEYGKGPALFKAIENSEGGIADTGISFVRVL